MATIAWSPEALWKRIVSTLGLLSSSQGPASLGFQNSIIPVVAVEPVTSTVSLTTAFNTSAVASGLVQVPAGQRWKIKAACARDIALGVQISILVVPLGGSNAHISESVIGTAAIFSVVANFNDFWLYPGDDIGVRVEVPQAATSCSFDLVYEKAAYGG